ncbi:MAG: hypothetical protein ABF289_02255 [Clostridiales bacterium]
MKYQKDIKQLLKNKYDCLEIVETVFPKEYKHLKKIYFKNLILCNTEYIGDDCLRIHGSSITEK